jgi:hypothetical protein
MCDEMLQEYANLLLQCSCNSTCLEVYNTQLFKSQIFAVTQNLGPQSILTFVYLNTMDETLH